MQNYPFDKRMREAENPALKILVFALLLVSLVPPSIAFSLADSGLTFHAIANLLCEVCVEKLQPLVDTYGDK